MHPFHMSKYTVYLFAAFVIPFHLFSQNGNLDYSFGRQGKVEYNIAHYNESITSAALQTNGKIVVAGHIQRRFSPNELMIARFNENGSVDETFGTDGLVETDIDLYTPSQYYSPLIKIQKDGKIVIGATALVGNRNPERRFLIVRLLEDGSFDSSFSDDGWLIFSESKHRIRSTSDFFDNFIIEEDGKIILSGMSWLGYNHFLLTRLNPDGSFDDSFGDGGFVFSGLNPASGGLIQTTYQQEDGKVIQAGFAVVSNVDNWQQPVFVRYHPHGELDASFGNEGVLVMDVNGYDEIINLNVLSNGKILAIGKGFDEHRRRRDFFLLKLNQDGTVDESFGDQGFQWLNIRGTKITTAVRQDSSIALYIFTQPVDTVLILNEKGDVDHTIAIDGTEHARAISYLNCNGCFQIDEDDNMIMAHSIYEGINENIAIRKLLLDGRADESFGDNGLATKLYEDLSEFPNAIAVLKDSTIISVGHTYQSGFVNKGFLMHLTPNGELTKDLYPTGFMSPYLDVDTIEERLNDIVELDDGSLLIAGRRRISESDTRRDIVIYKFLTNGRLDRTFGKNGEVVLAHLDDQEVEAIAVQNNGKILLAGYSGAGGGLDLITLRLNVNGQIDSTYGLNGLVFLELDSAQWATDVVIHGNEIFVSGFSVDSDPEGDIIIVKLDQTGAFDSNFGDNGLVRIDSNTEGYDFANEFRVQEDGKIIIGAIYDDHFALIRLNTNGNLDDSFGTNGVSLVENSMIKGGACTSIQLMDDGRIIGVGYLEDEFRTPAIVRLLPDGQLDQRFGMNGIIRDTEQEHDYIYGYPHRCSFLSKDGSILTAGSTWQGVFVAKYLNDLNVGLIENKGSHSEVALIYPNPIFNTAMLKFEMKEKANVHIYLVSSEGKSIHTFMKGVKNRGEHILELDFSTIQSGVHYCVVQTNNSMTTTKIFVTK